MGSGLVERTGALGREEREVLDLYDDHSQGVTPKGTYKTSASRYITPASRRESPVPRFPKGVVGVGSVAVPDRQKSWVGEV